MNRALKRITLSLVAATLLVPASFASANTEPGSTSSFAARKGLYEVRTLAGSGLLGLVDGAGAAAAFRAPASLTVRADGSLLVSDEGNQRIRQVQNGQVTTVSGVDLGPDDFGFLQGSFNDGGPQTAAFQTPAGLTSGANGAIYLADAGNHAIRMLDSRFNATTVAGDGIVGFEDGPAATARFDSPQDVAVTASGVIYVADTLNHVIRKIENGQVSTLTAPSTRVIEYGPGVVALAGDFRDGPLAQARFNEPSGLALDARGNLYVSDTGNQRIRYIDFEAGTVITVAGGAVPYAANEAYAEGEFADGSALDARFHAPRGLSVTSEGGVLIADSLNHAVRYLLGGRVYTLVGSPEASGRRNGTAAFGEFNLPYDVVPVGTAGAFAVSDYGNNVIRLVSPYAYPAGLKRQADIQLLLGNERLESDQPPIIRAGTTFVPVRVVTESLGYEVGYSNRQAQLVSGDTTYRLTVGSAEIVRELATGELETITLANPIFSLNGRLYVPVRFFAEELGLDVQWLADVRTVLLREPYL